MTDADFVLGAKTRIKIIRELYKLAETNTTDLARRLGLSYNQLEVHLRILREAGIIEEHRIGRVRLVSLRREPEVLELAKAISDLAQLLERAKKASS